MAKRRGRTRSRGVNGNTSTRVPTERAAPAAQPSASQRRSDPHDLRCALCERAIERFTVHHLVPRARGGNHGPTARFCSTCHRQVHAMFSETTLAEELYSVELLHANHRVAAFLNWMRKQRAAAFRVRRARDRN